MSMTSSRPYLVRAVYEWILDNGLTPQVVIDASVQDVMVPREYVQDRQIVLNISPTAVRHLELGNEEIEFDARFGGKPFKVTAPMRAVLAVVARENGAGMSCPEESHDDEPPPENGSDKPGRPALRVVK